MQEFSQSFSGYRLDEQPGEIIQPVSNPEACAVHCANRSAWCRSFDYRLNSNGDQCILFSWYPSDTSKRSPDANSYNFAYVPWKSQSTDEIVDSPHDHIQRISHIFRIDILFDTLHTNTFPEIYCAKYVRILWQQKHKNLKLDEIILAGRPNWKVRLRKPPTSKLIKMHWYAQSAGGKNSTFDTQSDNSRIYLTQWYEQSQYPDPKVKFLPFCEMHSNYLIQVVVLTFSVL